MNYNSATVTQYLYFPFLSSCASLWRSTASLLDIWETLTFPLQATPTPLEDLPSCPPLTTEELPSDHKALTPTTTLPAPLDMELWLEELPMGRTMALQTLPSLERQVDTFPEPRLDITVVSRITNNNRTTTNNPLANTRDSTSNSPVGNRSLLSVSRTRPMLVTEASHMRESKRTGLFPGS